MSIAPAGTVLAGLNYAKGKDDPVALPEEEYPEWLWSCLDVRKKDGADDGGEEGDMFCKFDIFCSFGMDVLLRGRGWLLLRGRKASLSLQSHSKTST